MGLMNMIRKMGEKKKVSAERMAEVAQERKIQKILDDREKSSNERELEGIMKKKREESIKERLDEIRKMENKRNWKSGGFCGKTTMLNNDQPILKNDRPLLKEKNIFKGNQNNMGMNRLNKMNWKGSL